MNCFNCEMKRTCKSCIDLISQKKTSSNDTNMLKMKLAIEFYQKVPYFEGENEPIQNNIDFECARNKLMKEDYELIVKRRFERIYSTMECKSYMKNENIPEKKRDNCLWIRTY